MKKVTIFAALAILLATAVTTVVFAVGRDTQAKKATLTKVTVAVSGFHCQGCPDELQRDLAKLNGVADVKATLSPAQVTASIDEEKITVSQFVNAIAKHPTGMDRTKTYGAKLVAFINTAACAEQKTMCGACAPEEQKRLSAIDGVKTVTIDKTGKVAGITFAPDAKVTTAQLAKALGESDFHFTVSFTAPTADAAPAPAGAPSCH